MNAYNHYQTEASTEWIITHNLNSYPISDVTLDYENGSKFKTLPAAVEYIDANTVAVRFSIPRTGTVRLVGQNNFMMNVPPDQPRVFAAPQAEPVAKAGILDGMTYFYGEPITLPNSPEYGFGTGDFTMQVRVNPEGDGCLLCLRTDGETQFFNNNLIISKGKLMWSDGARWHTTGAEIPMNEWTHIAITRADGIVRMFINGVLDLTFENTTDLGSSRMVYIGAFDNLASPFTGFMDGLKITKGEALYVEDFMPAT